LTNAVKKDLKNVNSEKDSLNEFKNPDLNQENMNFKILSEDNNKSKSKNTKDDINE